MACTTHSVCAIFVLTLGVGYGCSGSVRNATCESNTAVGGDGALPCATGGSGANGGAAAGGAAQDAGPPEVESIACGDDHCCALMNNHTVRCWGGGISQAHVVPELETVAMIAAGPKHNCAVLGNRTVRCWGSNESGQLGDGTVTARTTPVEVFGLTNATALAAGTRHTCALLRDKSVTCWGYNSDGELGDGTTVSHLHPTTYVAGLSSVASIGAGDQFSCALLQNGRVACWGLNEDGRLGNALTGEPGTIVAVSDLMDETTELSVGRDWACARLRTARAQCWGQNETGQLGDGTKASKTAPVLLDLLNVSSIQLGKQGHTCATVDPSQSDASVTAASVFCWGSNDYGQFGITPSTSPALLPLPLTLEKPKQLSLGGQYTCVLTDKGEVKCAGRNQLYQLGNGTTLDSPVWVTVTGLH